MMSAAPEPDDPAGRSPEISEAAELARSRLHEEIERVRRGVEEILDEQEAGGRGGGGGSTELLRRELDELRLETRNYVKKRVRKSEKRLGRSIRELESRADRLENRLDEVVADRAEAEWRIHNATERMLDGLLRDVRSIADRLEAYSPAARPAPPGWPPR